MLEVPGAPWAAQWLQAMEGKSPFWGPVPGGGSGQQGWWEAAPLCIRRFGPRGASFALPGSSCGERWGAAPDGAPRVSSTPGGEHDASSPPPTPTPARLSPVLKRSSAPAFSSSFPHVSL